LNHIHHEALLLHKIVVLTSLNPEIESAFQKLKGKASRAKKQLFEEGSSSSSSIEATEIDNEGWRR